MFKLTKLKKRIISGLSAAVMLAGNILPLTVAYAEPEGEVVPAHSVAVFDIDLKSGAEHYSVYEPSLPAEGGKKQIDDAYVWKADSSADGHKFVFNIKFSVSGVGTTSTKPDGMTDDEFEATKEAVGRDFINIRIPAHILKFSGMEAGEPVDGVYPDTLELPVPKESDIDPSSPVGRHQFAYRYDEETDEYVIFNREPVSAGVVYEFPVAYTMNKNTWEYKDLDPSKSFSASAVVNSWPQEETPSEENRIVLPKDTREIPVYIDTNAEIKTAKKRVEQTLIGAQAARKLTGLSDLTDDYRYVIWSVTSDISNVTQKYDLTLVEDGSKLALTGVDANDKTHTVNGEIVAVNMGSGYEPYAGETGAKVTGLTASGKRVDYILTRFPNEGDGESEGLNDLEDSEKTRRDIVLKSTNSAEVILDPGDAQDISSIAPASGSFKYELLRPTIPPIQEKYTANKYGLYANGTKRVSSTANVASYDLAVLAVDEDIPELRYETRTTGHAYGKTIEHLNQVFSAVIVPEELDEDGNATISVAGRNYIFNKDSREYTREIYSDDLHSELEQTDVLEIPDDYELPMNILTMLQAVGEDLRDNYYGKTPIEYVLDDRTLNVADIKAPSDAKKLGPDDYRIDYVDYTYDFVGYVYDKDTMTFTEGEPNSDPDDNDEYNTLHFYAYIGGSDEPIHVADYNVVTGDRYADSDYVSVLNSGKIMFNSDVDVTGYRIVTENTYYYVDLDTKPSVTLKSSPDVKELAEKILSTDDVEKKIALTNTADWTATHTGDDVLLYKTTVKGTDYVADVTRDSSISKKAMGERFSYRGQDGKIYKSSNDTLNGYYQLAWKTTVKEWVVGDNTPVKQESGVIYDLLPSHCDIIEGSVNVYADAGDDVSIKTTPLSPSEFHVLERQDNYNDTGKKLLTIEINEPCAKSYTITYVTVHTHDDIQDYGSIALNTVAYQTGNGDIGSGYPDNGGNYAVSMSDYIHNLDKNNGNARRFIYAEATEDILALFPTSSGIYKKVATSSDPAFGRTAIVHNGESYTYNIRMKNDSSTKARDIAILDSVENYRTHDGVRYNFGLVGKDRDWYGVIESFNLQSVEDKIAQYVEIKGEENTAARVSDLKLFLYVGDGPDDIVNFEQEDYSDSASRMYLLNAILGNEEKAESALMAKLKKEAREQPEYSSIPEEQRESWCQQYAEDHFDAAKAQAQSDTALGKWKNVDWKTLTEVDGGEPVDMEKVSAFIVYTGESFVLGKGETLSFDVKMRAPKAKDLTDHLEETADPDNGVFLTQPSTYNNVYRSFTNFPEEKDDNYNENVNYYYTHYDYTQVMYRTVGTLEFGKNDSQNGKSIPGVVFNLSGVSDYGTVYNQTLTSDSSGKVIFKDLERGTYTLIESESDADHLIDTSAKRVTVIPLGDVTIATVDNTDVVIRQEGEADGKPRIEQYGNLIREIFYSLDDDNNEVITEQNYSVENDPRYHGDLEFTKTDSVTGRGAAGAVFTLSGISDHNNQVDRTAVSGSDGKVVFQDLERGTYTLTEVSPAEGYLPPLNNVYTVTGTGTTNVFFSITGEGVENDGGNFVIKNEPMTTMELQKTDAITKKFLRDAVFCLKADSSLSDTIANLNAKTRAQIRALYPDASEDELNALYEKALVWEQGADGYKQTVDGSNTSLGTYLFKELPRGNYVLEEVSSPKGYGALGRTYSVNVGSENGRFLITFTDKDSHMSYVYYDGDDYTSTSDASKAEAYRITNDQTYEDGKTVIKSWIGGTGEDGKFPVLHLKNEKPEEKPKKVTINGNLKTLINNNRSKFTGFKRVYDYDESDVSFKSYKLEGVDDEDGVIYMRWNSTINKIEWYSDAAKIYFPIDASQMFSNCDSAGFTSFTFGDVDSPFDTSKTTTMKEMFRNCTNLTSLDISSFDTSNVTNMYGMFWNCNKLTSLDLNNFNTSKVTDMSYMFNRCNSVSSINVSSFDTSKVTTMYLMFGNGGDNYSNSNNSLKTLDLSSFSTESLTNIRDMFIRQLALETIYVDPAQWQTGFIVPSSTVTLGGKIYPHNDSNGGNTFKNCNSLRGGNGTAHGTGAGDNSNNGSNWAIADEASDQDLNGNGVFGEKGYFTAKSKTTDLNGSMSVVGRLPHYLGAAVEEVYKNFRPDGDPVKTETDETSNTFTFEYVTEDEGELRDGAYYVPEHIYMYENVITEEDGVRYKTTQKYVYKLPAEAKWTHVTRGGTSQWYCEMAVSNADELMYAWEDKVEGYTTTADQNSPISTQGDDGPVITNAGKDEKIGSLKLVKTLTGTESEKYISDTFYFKVTMKNKNGSPYNMLPFDDNGVAYFAVTPNVSSSEQVVIKGIPAGCTYTVEEVTSQVTSGDDTYEMPYGYAKDTSSGLSGTIADNTPKTAKISNRILTADLDLSKTAVLLKKNDSGVFAPVTDTTDEDLTDWTGRVFSYRLTFYDLVKGQDYTYTIGSSTYHFTGSTDTNDTNVPVFTLSSGQSVKFKDIPIGTRYTVTEISDGLVDTDDLRYSVKYVLGGETVEDSYTVPLRELPEGGESIAFTNTKEHDKEETVSVSVEKQWFSENGDRVNWADVDGTVKKGVVNNGEFIGDDDGAFVTYTTFDAQGKPVYDTESYYPSFLKIYLGRAMKLPDSEVYFDLETSYTSESLNAKGSLDSGSWKCVFKDLPKYGSTLLDGNEVKCEYIYYVTEVVPIGFHNSNGTDDFTTISDGSFVSAVSSGKDSYTALLKNQKDASHSLSVCKRVTGNMGNKVKEFNFKVRFEVPTGETTYEPLVGSGVVMKIIDVNTGKELRSARTLTLTKDMNGTHAVSIPHDTKIVFMNLPNGTRYTITENGGDGYEVYSGVYTGDVRQVKVSALEENAKVQQGTLDTDKDYLYMNDLTVNVPTGIDLPMAAPVLIASGILGWYLLKKLRERQETETE